jgi:hypothetical protein
VLTDFGTATEKLTYLQKILLALENSGDEANQMVAMRQTVAISCNRAHNC